MKTHAQGLAVVALGLFLASSAAAGPGDGINGTVHDLSQSSYATGTDTLQRICIFCHAPHNTYKLSEAAGGPPEGQGGGNFTAPEAYDYLPLWNHELTENYASFTMYQNGTGAPQSGPKASQAIANGMEPGSTSLLCLSCHDGSVAVSSYGNPGYQLPQSIGNNAGMMIADTFVIGKDAYLGNHHPIGFEYGAVAAVDDEIRDADIATLGAAGTVGDHLDGNGKMQCTTCHSVHNKGNTGETLLWRSDQNSRLCLTCHIKGDDPMATIP